MGVDIHMSIINAKGEYIYNDIFNGRDYAWFDNLCCRGEDAYNIFPCNVGIPSLTPKEIHDDYDSSSEYGYYGFHYVIVDEFNQWFQQTRPQVSAGWITTYDKWMYENKRVYPADVMYHLTSDLYETHDYHFVELKDDHEGSLWLYTFIKEHDIPCDAMIVYYFDC